MSGLICKKFQLANQGVILLGHGQRITLMEAEFDIHFVRVRHRGDIRTMKSEKEIMNEFPLVKQYKTSMRIK